jgi:alpha-D-xyloside xylohydrolase
MKQIYPGVWSYILGEPETVTPVRLRFHPPAGNALQDLPASPVPPILPETIQGSITPRGCRIILPLGDKEQVYGFGLQFQSFNQRGRKKTVRVNSDPKADLGDSHAPLPFFVTTAGYAVLVDTARYATFYCGSARLKRDRSKGEVLTDAVIIEIPRAEGVEIYFFSGISDISDSVGGENYSERVMLAIQRYNLFSGGGCLPPRWGLGFWYRSHSDYSQQNWLKLADDLRREEIPCDVLGLEGNWQSHTYSCSFLWRDTFPKPAEMVQKMVAEHYHVNLWSHIFTHVSSNIYQQLYPFSGNYEVWEGLVPDLTYPEARQIIQKEFTQQHVDLGTSGYKLDECDNSDYVQQPWSFPELAQFPSGLDGEQMHQVFGVLFQQTVDELFRSRNLRSYGEVRSSGALAAPYPYVLYSDLYDHREFIRGVANCGFNGLLWCPEVRHAVSAEDLIRRLQVVVFSPQALINAFYIMNPPWKQWVTELNNAGQFAENYAEVQAICQELLQVRMQLIPYLYTAFYHYQSQGIPPFRALVVDYPDDPNTWNIDDEWMIGDRLLVAPVTAGIYKRKIYLPAGSWYHFMTGQVVSGGTFIDWDVPLNSIPVFIKAGSVLPLAQSTLHTADAHSLDLTVHVYGDGSLPITLFEDDGLTYDYLKGDYNLLKIAWNITEQAVAQERTGDCRCPGYRVLKWEMH